MCKAASYHTIQKCGCLFCFGTSHSGVKRRFVLVAHDVPPFPGSVTEASIQFTPPHLLKSPCSSFKSTNHLPTQTQTNYKSKDPLILPQLFPLSLHNYSTYRITLDFNSFTAIMSANTVHVKNISPSTSEQEIKDFFSFW